jgi:hypothetical protein
MLDEVNVTQGQEELLKMTRGDYFTFITREDELRMLAGQTWP